ncbi:Qat anti-phage system QueC-like protein QatC [Colwellia ponticola]|uniref:7-cyano-7-deazaguanine synthase n=1 Tax=Colwellia ponticola TaxID=2304625 RepID=A0A8H2JNR6_9GAMM|nr:Qat anti-phage system QueC-like protein QatC [Colwellia ponticola]TMM45726.1 hypothetical protein FCS21_07855 [Colwellia ponticola]
MKRCSVFGVCNEKEKSLLSSDNNINIYVKLPSEHIKTPNGIGAFVKRTAVFMNKPNLIAAEFLNLASLIYAADTRVSRYGNSEDGWTREFDITMPVNQTTVWVKQKNELQRILGFLTGDKWNIKFRQRPDDNLLKIVAPTESKVDFDFVSLLSGGLDSLIGAIDLLEEEKKTIFVGHYSSDGTQNYQKDVEKTLLESYQSNFIGFAKGNITFDINSVAINDQEENTENSQRSRSFLFLAMANYIAASNDKKVELIVPENGFIALNIPLDPLRIGAHSTRTVHPHFLRSMNEVFKNFHFQVVLNNPYRHMTKGEMVLKCQEESVLKKVAGKTLSCASPTKMRFDQGGLKAKRLGGIGGKGNCGYCYPCLIRKAAFNRASIKDETSYVAINDFSQAKIKAGKEGKGYAESRDIMSVKYAGFRLSEGKIKPQIEIHKSGSLTGLESEWKDISGMYERGLKEVYELVKNVKIELAR